MADRAPAETELAGPVAGVITAVLRRAIRTQSGVARAYVRLIRERHPDQSPAQIRRTLDSRFLAMVTVSGVAVGAAGAVPGVGTVVAVGAIGAESIVFLEAAAFYTLAVAEGQVVDVRDGHHEELLAVTVTLGASGAAILSHAISSGGGSTAGGSLAARSLRIPGLKEVNRRMVSRFVRKFAVRRATLAMGKLAPAGIGAAVGGWGNRRLGRVVVDTADATFGAPPEAWPAA